MIRKIVFRSLPVSFLRWSKKDSVFCPILKVAHEVGSRGVLWSYEGSDGPENGADIEKESACLRECAGAGASYVRG